MAEKIARLTRRTPARDVYDLAWISSTSPHSGFDRVLVRRLVSQALGRDQRVTEAAAGDEVSVDPELTD
jgi:predicted nucleotidyltransferase component of viral defense system